MTVVLYFGLIPATSSLTSLCTTLRIPRVTPTSFFGSRLFLLLIAASTSWGVGLQPSLFASLSVTLLKLGSSSSIQEIALFSSFSGDSV